MRMLTTSDSTAKIRAMKTILEAEPTILEIDLARTTVIVIDMENAYAQKGGMFDLLGLNIDMTRSIIPTIDEVLTASRDIGRKVVYIAHAYSPDFRELGEPDSVLWVRDWTHKNYHEHPEWRNRMAIRHTWGTEIVEELTPHPDDIVVEKTRYSAFFKTNLDVILRALDTRYLVFVGVQTNICVESSLREALHHGYYPILIKDATATSSEAAHEAAVANVRRGYGWVTTGQDFIKTSRQFLD